MYTDYDNLPDDSILFADETRGIYIPQYFVSCFVDNRAELLNVDDDTFNIVAAGPEHNDYWEAWQDITDNAVVLDSLGNRHTMQQDGDLWLIPEQV